MENCKSSLIPIDPKLNIAISEGKTEKPFRKLVGCLMYLMLGTRLDICFSVHYFSRLQERACNVAWSSLKKVIKYLQGTINLGLEYHRNDNNQLNCYVDVDWGGDTHDRKSVNGFVSIVFNNTLCWSSRKQTCVSLSTTESELITLCSSVTEGLWLKRLFFDLGLDFKFVTFFEDN